mmetsp:Transcript_14446/g.21753  ORF Transcript_14446/g.21753 Transcript_14446/m.21753 type:complete len:240 (+) Transcript_14446:107-826(+)|eukprot:scaffold1560_cov146-Skeletonema_dohrnii-CCMP3373.AAC.5
MNPSVGAPSPSKGAAYDEELMAEQQQQPTTAEANDVSPDAAAPPANTRSKTTSILIALIAISSGVIVALSVLLTRPNQSENQAEMITIPPSSYPSISPSSRPTTAIPNWDLNFLDIASNFTGGSTNEITFMYEIGAGRKYIFGLFAQGCTDNVTGLNHTITPVTTPTDNYVTENLNVLLDIKNMASIRTSNIWNEIASTMEMCITLQLISGKTGMVVRKDNRNIALELVNVGVFGGPSA